MNIGLASSQNLDNQIDQLKEYPKRESLTRLLKV